MQNFFFPCMSKLGLHKFLGLQKCSFVSSNSITSNLKKLFDFLVYLFLVLNEFRLHNK